VDQPLPTVATAGAIRLVQPFITPNFSERKGQKPRIHSIHQPMPAVTGHGAGMLVEPFIHHATHQGAHARRCHSIHKPLPTVTGAKRGELKLVEPIIVQTDQTGGNGHYSRPLNKPLGTIVSKQNMLLVQPMIGKYYGTGRCKAVDEPLDTVTTRDRFMLVEFKATIEGKPKGKGRIVGELDILTRMLQPHELAKAHSLDNFKLTGTKEDQTTQIGNSVPRKLAEAHAYTLLKS
jgi:DNA (cytosine-5)-methyltransferase 1